MDLRRIAARIANIEQLELRDVQGDPEYYTPTTPEERAVYGESEEFKKFLQEKLGLSPGQPIKYEDAIQALVEEGLDEKKAKEYALWAAQDFVEHSPQPERPFE